MTNSVLAIVKNGKIELIDNFPLPEGTKLLVTPLADSSDDEIFVTNWRLLSLQGLNNAYDQDESEYSLELIKDFNPDYEGS